MRAGEAFPGQLVTHYPYEPGGQPRDGEITDIREAGWVMVRFAGETVPRQVDLRNLTRRDR